MKYHPIGTQIALHDSLCNSRAGRSGQGISFNKRKMMYPVYYPDLFNKFGYVERNDSHIG